MPLLQFLSSTTIFLATGLIWAALLRLLVPRWWRLLLLPALIAANIGFWVSLWKLSEKFGFGSIVERVFSTATDSWFVNFADYVWRGGLPGHLTLLLLGPIGSIALGWLMWRERSRPAIQHFTALVPWTQVVIVPLLFLLFLVTPYETSEPITNWLGTRVVAMPKLFWNTRLHILSIYNLVFFAPLVAIAQFRQKRLQVWRTGITVVLLVAFLIWFLSWYLIWTLPDICDYSNVHVKQLSACG